MLNLFSGGIFVPKGGKVSFFLDFKGINRVKELLKEFYGK
jgi:hypothetical protein